MGAAAKDSRVARATAPLMHGRPPRTCSTCLALSQTLARDWNSPETPTTLAVVIKESASEGGQTGFCFKMSSRASHGREGL